mgnify:CR=1 FL=1
MPIRRCISNEWGRSIDYFSRGRRKGWAKLNKLRAPNEADAQRLGKSAAALSRDRGVPIEQTPHADYGTVNRYAQSVLEVVFKGWR